MLTKVKTCLLPLALLPGLATAWVDLDTKIFPSVPSSLPVLSLGPPNFLPQHFLEEIISNVCPDAAKNFTADPEDPSKFYAYAGEELVASLNKKTGEAKVFPNYGNLTAAQAPIDINYAVKHFKKVQKALFPPDETRVEFAKGSSLVGGTYHDTQGPIHSRTNDGEEGTFLTTVFVKRTMEAGGTTWAFCGPGSQTVFGVSSNNRISSLSYIWRTAQKSELEIKTKSPGQAIKHIKEALEGKGRETGQCLKVYRVDLCYFSGGGRVAQPVYRVFGKSTGPDTSGRNETETNHVLRYFAVGETSPEDLPGAETVEHGEEEPVLEGSQDHPKRSVLDYFKARSNHKRGIKPTITLGRYVTREDADEALFPRQCEGFLEKPPYLQALRIRQLAVLLGAPKALRLVCEYSCQQRQHRSH